jgi:glutathione S-transferase
MSAMSQTTSQPTDSPTMMPESSAGPEFSDDSAEPEKLKLTYFDLGIHGARAFVARVCLRKLAAESSVPPVSFEDARLPFASWAPLKASGAAPLNQLPTLQIGDRTLTQSVPISAYAARRAGLYPTDPLAMFASEEVVAIVDEVWNKLSSTSKNRPESRVAYANDVAPKYLSLLCKRLGDDAFFGGAAAPLWADLWVMQYVAFLSSGFYDGVPTDFITRHAPLLVAHAERVRSSELYVKFGTPE